MTAASTPAQIARLNDLLDGPLPFQRGDLELSAAGLVEIHGDGLTELTGAWTLEAIVQVSGYALPDAPQAEARRRFMDGMGCGC